MGARGTLPAHRMVHGRHADREANRVVAFAAAPPTAWHVRYYRDDGLTDGPVLIGSTAVLDLDWGGAPPAAGLPATGFGLRSERPAGLPDEDRLITLTLRGGAALFAPFGRAPLVVAGDPAVRAVGARLHAAADRLCRPRGASDVAARCGPVAPTVLSVGAAG